MTLTRAFRFDRMRIFGTGSKLSVCIEDVYRFEGHRRLSASTQLVFCDVTLPKPGNSMYMMK